MRSYQTILKYFNGNVDQTNRWFTAKNPLLGDIAPIDMYKVGRGKKLDDFIYRLAKQNESPR